MMRFISSVEDIYSEISDDSFIPKHIYISIGSKLNEEYIEIEKEKIKSNAQYQMYPEFLRNKKNVLLVIIDYFSNDDNLEKNKQLLENITFSAESDNVPKIVIFNLCDFEKVVSGEIYFLNYILHILNYKSQETSIMICNYIKYFNEPTKIEIIRTKNIIEKIKFAINIKNMEPENIYYEWFGYNYMLYNIICNCKYIPIGFFQILNKLICEHMISLQYTGCIRIQLSKELIVFICQSSGIENLLLQKILYCLTHCVDISSTI
jgi:hypothetical protein